MVLPAYSKSSEGTPNASGRPHIRLTQRSAKSTPSRQPSQSASSTPDANGANDTHKKSDSDPKYHKTPSRRSASSSNPASHPFAANCGSAEYDFKADTSFGRRNHSNTTTSQIGLHRHAVNTDSHCDTAELQSGHDHSGLVSSGNSTSTVNAHGAPIVMPNSKCVTKSPRSTKERMAKKSHRSHRNGCKEGRQSFDHTRHLAKAENSSAPSNCPLGKTSKSRSSSSNSLMQRRNTGNNNILTATLNSNLCSGGNNQQTSYSTSTMKGSVNLPPANPKHSQNELSNSQHVCDSGQYKQQPQSSSTSVRSHESLALDEKHTDESIIGPPTSGHCGDGKNPNNSKVCNSSNWGQLRAPPMTPESATQAIKLVAKFLDKLHFNEAAGKLADISAALEEGQETASTTDRHLTVNRGGGGTLWPSVFELLCGFHATLTSQERETNFQLLEENAKQNDSYSPVAVGAVNLYDEANTRVVTEKVACLLKSRQYVPPYHVSAWFSQEVSRMIDDSTGFPIGIKLQGPPETPAAVRRCRNNLPPHPRSHMEHLASILGYAPVTSDNNPGPRPHSVYDNSSTQVKLSPLFDTLQTHSSTDLLRPSNLASRTQTSSENLRRSSVGSTPIVSTNAKDTSLKTAYVGPSKCVPKKSLSSGAVWSESNEDAKPLHGDRSNLFESNSYIRVHSGVSLEKEGKVRRLPGQESELYVPKVLLKQGETDWFDDTDEYKDDDDPGYRIRYVSREDLEKEVLMRIHNHPAAEAIPYIPLIHTAVMSASTNFGHSLSCASISTTAPPNVMSRGNSSASQTGGRLSGQTSGQTSGGPTPQPSSGIKDCSSTIALGSSSSGIIDASGVTQSSAFLSCNGVVNNEAAVSAPSQAFSSSFGRSLSVECPLCDDPVEVFTPAPISAGDAIAFSSAVSNRADSPTFGGSDVETPTATILTGQANPTALLAGRGIAVTDKEAVVLEGKAADALRASQAFCVEPVVPRNNASDVQRHKSAEVPYIKPKNSKKRGKTKKCKPSHETADFYSATANTHQSTPPQPTTQTEERSIEQTDGGERQIAGGTSIVKVADAMDKRPTATRVAKSVAAAVAPGTGDCPANKLCSESSASKAFVPDAESPLRRRRESFFSDDELENAFVAPSSLQSDESLAEIRDDPFVDVPTSSIVVSPTFRTCPAALPLKRTDTDTASPILQHSQSPHQQIPIEKGFLLSPETKVLHMAPFTSEDCGMSPPSFSLRCSVENQPEMFSLADDREEETFSCILGGPSSYVDSAAGSVSSTAQRQSFQLPPPSAAQTPSSCLTQLRQSELHYRIDEDNWNKFYCFGDSEKYRETKKQQRKQSSAHSRFPHSSDPRFPLILGADEILDCFNLKVIHERQKTGLEVHKDFAIRVDQLIAGRYRVEHLLGQATFSRAVQCYDTVSKQNVCLKIIKNEKDFVDQSLDEVKLLRYININGDVDHLNCLRLHDFFYFKEHLMIVTELLRENLYEFGKHHKAKHSISYFTMGRIQKIACQVLTAMNYIHGLRLVHCDLKPENILMKDAESCHVKVIDFGSSCFEDDELSSYVQSRSYRAPEVLLQLPYDSKIDIWSLGCILAELWTGYVLFLNDSTESLMARIVGIIGIFPRYMTANVPQKLLNQKFTQDGQLFQPLPNNPSLSHREPENFRVLLPKMSSLKQRMRTDDTLFIDFLSWLLQIDPFKRPCAAEALCHPWLAAGRYVDGIQSLGQS